jgi:hypothetical protein
MNQEPGTSPHKEVSTAGGPGGPKYAPPPPPPWANVYMRVGARNCLYYSAGFLSNASSTASVRESIGRLSGYYYLCGHKDMEPAQ